jgi:hypothetical protein
LMKFAFTVENRFREHPYNQRFLQNYTKSDSLNHKRTPNRPPLPGEPQGVLTRFYDRVLPGRIWYYIEFTSNYPVSVAATLVVGTCDRDRIQTSVLSQRIQQPTPIIETYKFSVITYVSYDSSPTRCHF